MNCWSWRQYNCTHWLPQLPQLPSPPTFLPKSARSPSRNYFYKLKPPSKNIWCWLRDKSNIEQIVRNNNILAVMWAESQNRAEKKLQNSIKMIDLFPIQKNTLDIIYNKTLLTHYTIHIHVSMSLVWLDQMSGLAWSWWGKESETVQIRLL